MADTFGTENLIDRIVEGVLGQLGRPATTASISAVPPASPVPPAAKVLEIADSVVTAALLEERGINVGPISFGAKSVLTPSARELLKQRNIEWNFSQTSQGSPNGGAKWLAVVVRSTPATSAALEMMANESCAQWQRDLLGCAIQAAGRAVGALCRGEIDGAVVFTGKPELVACRANRNPKIRAATVATPVRVKSLSAELGANLFAIDPAQSTAFELRNLLRAIGSVKPTPPNDWNE